MTKVVPVPKSNALELISSAVGSAKQTYNFIASNLKEIGLILQFAVVNSTYGTRQLSGNVQLGIAHMMHEGKSLIPDQVTELLTANDQSSLSNLLTSCSLDELRVFHDGLSKICAHNELMHHTFQPLQDKFKALIREAMAHDGRHELELVFNQPESALQATVVTALQAKTEVQKAGQILCSALASNSVNLSIECHGALKGMATLGNPLKQGYIEELQTSKVLSKCFESLSASKLAELRAAVGKAASSGLGMELMALWSIIHGAVNDKIIADASNVTESCMAMTDNIILSSKEASASIGKLFLLAFASSIELSSAVSIELHDAMKELADHGTLIANHLMIELETNLHLIAKALPKEKLIELHQLCRQTVEAEWSQIDQFASQLKETITQIPDSPAVDALQDVTMDIYNSPITKMIIQEGFASLDLAFTQSRESIESAMHTIINGLDLNAGTCTSILAMLPPLLRFEIARDFCQTVSMFLTNLYGEILDHKDAPIIRATQAFFRAFYDIISADFAKLWDSKRELLIDIGFIVLLLLIGAIYASYLWFAFSARHLHKRSEEIRQGHEGTTWANIAAKQQMRVKVFTYVITACLSIYLPVTRLALEILSAKKSNDSVKNDDSDTTAYRLLMDRYRSESFWPVLMFLAVWLLATFTLPLPLLLMRAITDNRPSGSLENPLVTYDLDGEEVPFNDKIYTRLVAKDPSQLRCPYHSLYAGFEKKWSHYKIFQLLAKVVLIVPLLTVPQRGFRGIFTGVIYSLVVATTFYGTPFSDPLNNIMEISGKVAALVTCAGGTILAFSESANTQTIVGTVVNLVNLVNLVVMAGIFLFGMKKTRLIIKNWLGTLTFSDTVRDIQDAPSTSILPQWDIEREAKHRIWQEFWKTLLLSLHDETIIYRLCELEQAVTQSGIHNIKKHWQGQADEYIASMRLAARKTLEGIDVYWNDASGTRDGHLDSQTCFGKMYILPYPFHCIMVYDDAKDESIVRDDKFAALLAVNFSSDILRKRRVRQKIRALGDCGVGICYPFSREEQVTVEDGKEIVSQGDSKTVRTRYTTVTFTCHYTNGHLSVEPNDTKRPMAAGFNVLMTYCDGYGDAVAPHTGKVHHQQNRVANMGPEHIGLTVEMEESPQLTHIFTQTEEAWMPALNELQKKYLLYREELIQRQAAANQVLGDGFWFFVYNNPRLTRAALERYLATEEINPLLQQLPITHVNAFDSLFKRMEYVHSHAALKFWYVFWDDLYSRNGEMHRLKPYQHELNPLKATSICYRVMKRQELEEWLKQRRLYGKPLSLGTVLLCQKTLFHSKLVDLLYEQMNKHMASNKL